jgi:ferric-dicitrate binding protein FerR (iron transport regulator)
METINDNIRQLLEMLDNPEAYTEQEIQDIINRDEDTRETYRMMAEAKRSSRQHQANKPIDVDAAWQKFNQKIQPQQHSFGWMKIAASFIGVLLVSGIAFAAIQIVRYTQQHTPKTEEVINTPKSANVTPADTLTTDTIATPQPIIYDNIPLEKMLPEIAAHYDAKVTFVNDEARQLRFRFVWNPQKGIDQVISDLNQFEHLTVTLKDNQITVE